ncbi:hypothetical protein AX17_003217 [Amanita inopinata Kibby_2008]|nr:hypothetical protein AX17_003217 [Amanita inopinata Kibby_2008]
MNGSDYGSDRGDFNGSSSDEEQEKPTRFQLPGFGLEYHHDSEDYSTLFNSVAGIVNHKREFQGLPLVTLREFAMLHLMNKWTDDPEWHKQISDKDVLAKWKEEAMETGCDGIKFSQDMFDYCIKELRGKARIYEKNGAVCVYDADVVKSDVVVSQDVKNALKDAVNRAKIRIPSNWLILPCSRLSMVEVESCLIALRVWTIVLSVADKGLPFLFLPSTEKSEAHWVLIRLVDDTSGCLAKLTSGEEAKITSFINNLHPQKHKDLYVLIEKIITKAIPLWNIWDGTPKRSGRRRRSV